MRNYYFKGNYGIRIIISAVILILGMNALATAAPGSLGDTAADKVFGQPNFTSNTANNGGVSANSIINFKDGVKYEFNF